MAAITPNLFLGDKLPGLADGAVVAGTFGKITTTAAGAILIATSAAGEICDGIIANTAASGEATTLAINGIGQMFVDGTTDIAADNHLGATTAGVGLKVTANTTQAGAYACEPRTANNATGIIRVLIQRHQVVA